MWCSTLMHDPQLNPRLHMHVLQQLWTTFRRQSRYTPPSQTWWNKVVPKTLSPTTPAWKVKAETWNIFYKHQEAISWKSRFRRRTLMKYSCLVLRCRFPTCSLAGTFRSLYIAWSHHQPHHIEPDSGGSTFLRHFGDTVHLNHAPLLRHDQQEQGDGTEYKGPFSW